MEAEEAAQYRSRDPSASLAAPFRRTRELAVPPARVQGVHRVDFELPDTTVAVEVLDDESEEPLAAARLHLGEGNQEGMWPAGQEVWTVSGEDGRAVARDLPAGRTSVHAVLDGYRPEIAFVDLVEGVPASVRLRLRPRDGVRLVFVDGGGRPLALSPHLRCELRAVEPPRVAHSSRSPLDQRPPLRALFFDSPPPGRYEVRLADLRLPDATTVFQPFEALAPVVVERAATGPQQVDVPVRARTWLQVFGVPSREDGPVPTQVVVTTGSPPTRVVPARGIPQASASAIRKPLFEGHLPPGGFTAEVKAADGSSRVHHLVAEGESMSLELEGP
jgi:hypothetical protein